MTILIEIFIVIPRGHVLAYKKMGGNGYWSSGQVEINKWLKDFRITCYGQGYPNLRVAWISVPNKFLESLNSSARVYKSEYHSLADAYLSLHFKEVNCNDAGNYTCETYIEGYDYVHRKNIELICK